MLLPANRILAAISQELKSLSGFDDGGNQGSLRQSLEIALRLLSAREAQGRDAIRGQLQTLANSFRPVVALLADIPSLNTASAALMETIERSANHEDLQQLESDWRQVLSTIEKLIRQAGQPSQVSPALHVKISQALTSWEAVDLQKQLQHESAASDESPALDGAQLQHYLQQRFDDGELAVTLFQPLSGGFGKQTYLFEVTGKKLSGAFVMRRDTELPLLTNDCHLIHNEFEVIRAVHGEGFPAPDAAWLDTEHDLLPGGNFLVMKRSPGAPGGSVFAAEGAIPADLSSTLAGILARLHNLPPLTALQACNESINSERGALPLRECVQRYLQDWFTTFCNEEHLPSPAIISQFNWLLANVPDAEGKPVLLHGDIGFHNFLFDNGKLSAVLDWEFAHLGDPAEDLAYVRNTVGGALDWPAFISAYEAAGGQSVDERRLRFFQVWGHLRNAASANIAGAKFVNGQANDLKLVILPHVYIPMFLQAAQAVIDQGLDGEA